MIFFPEECAQFAFGNAEISKLQDFHDLVVDGGARLRGSFFRMSLLVMDVEDKFNYLFRIKRHWTLDHRL
jgi:hypothetical protein